MKKKITRRTSLKAIAASAVAGGAWLANLAAPELFAYASGPKQPPGAKVTITKLSGPELTAAVATFLGAPEGKALGARLESLGQHAQLAAASASSFDYGGERRISLVVPYGSQGSQIAAFGTSLAIPEKAGASRVEPLGAELVKITAYHASAGSAVATHVFVADRAHQRIEITDLATRNTRTVTHADVAQRHQMLYPKPSSGLVGLGPTVASADACGWCEWITAGIAAVGMCAGAAWLACFVLFWDPPLAAACGVIVGVFGSEVLAYLCWALGLGFGASFGCYELGYCSCPWPWGC